MKAYSQQIYPIRSQEEWPRSGKLVMVKPEGKIQPGRPKKNRRLELDGIAPPGAKRLRRRFHRMRCSGCGLQGHNFRTCSKNNKNKANEAPADPGEYSRNVNREINQFVSSAIRDSSLQPATTQAEVHFKNL
ncbi:hypothetical protein CsatB_026842 [Cannabis sativa]